MGNLETRVQAMNVLYSDELALKDEENQHKLDAKVRQNQRVLNDKEEIYKKLLALKDAELDEYKNAFREIKRLKNINGESLDIVNSYIND